MIRRCLVVALLLSAATGCGAGAVSLRGGPRTFTAGDYDSVYTDWTRDQDVFDFGRLSDILAATATFESSEFRWAYVVRYADDYSISTRARTDMLRASLADAQEHHRFFVTLAGGNLREADLTDARSAWRVLLVDPSGEITTPLEIERVRRPTPLERTYFPSVSAQRLAFRVVFPARRLDGTTSIAPGAAFAILRFTGPFGQVDLTWRFENE